MVDFCALGDVPAEALSMRWHHVGIDKALSFVKERRMLRKENLVWRTSLFYGVAHALADIFVASGGLLFDRYVMFANYE